MPSTVQMPDGATLEFPDEMSQDDIRSAIKSKYKSKSAAEQLPDPGELGYESAAVAEPALREAEGISPPNWRQFGHDFLTNPLGNVSQDRGRKILETLYPPLQVIKHLPGGKEFEQGLSQSAAEQLTGMTAPAGLAYFTPVLGPAALAVGSAESVGTGAGNLVEALRQGNVGGVGRSLMDIGGGAAAMVPVAHGFKRAPAEAVKPPLIPKEVADAIQERGQTEVPVGETPGDRGALEQRVSAPETPAEARPSEVKPPDVPPESEVIPNAEETKGQKEGVLTPEPAAEPTAVPPVLSELDKRLNDPNPASRSTDEAVKLGDQVKTAEDKAAVQEWHDNIVKTAREKIAARENPMQWLMRKHFAEEVLEASKGLKEKGLAQEVLTKQTPKPPLPSEFVDKPVSESAAQIIQLPSEQWTKMVGDYKGTFGAGPTGLAYDLGSQAKTAADVAALKETALKLKSEAMAALKAGDFVKTQELGLRSQVANEAHQAATGVNIEGKPQAIDFIKKRHDPNYEPPVPDPAYKSKVGKPAKVPAAEDAKGKAAMEKGVPQQKQTRDRLKELLEREQRRIISEEQGKDILNTAEDEGRTPDQIAKEFFNNVYQSLDPAAKARLDAFFSASVGGLKPGDVIGTKPGPSGTRVPWIAQTWLDIIPDSIGANKIEQLQGTDRGLVAMMEFGNKNAGLKPISESPLKELPSATPPAAEAKAQTEVTKVANAEGKRSAAEIKDDLISSIQERLQKAPSEAKPGDTVTIEIPGDGTFTVNNTVEALSELLDRAKKIKTDAGKPPGVPKAALRSRVPFKEVPPEPPPAAPEASEPSGIGPGAAAAAEFSERNVPVAKTAHAVETAPPEQRPLGVTDSSTPLFARLSMELAGVPDGSTPASYSFSTSIKSMAGHSMPKITAALRDAGEAGVRYASSKIAAPYKAVFFSSKVLGTGVDPVKFGSALVEDNLRSVREGFKAEANKLRAAGKPDEAAGLDEKADNVRTIIGGEKSPFKTEEEYLDYLEDPKVKEAVQRHVQLWQEDIDPQYKMAQGLDPDLELPSRGLQTGARINLKALLEDETGTRPITSVRGGLTSSFKKKSPFAREAKGTGERYETNYPDLIANTYAKQLEIANQNNFNRVLVENGLAQVDKPGSQIKINGERTMSFPLTRRLLLKDGRAFPIGQNIYLPESLAGEYRRALNVDAEAKIPFVDMINAGLNKAALWGLTDATVHVGNLSTALFTRPGSNLLWDGLAKVTGRSDVPITLTKAVIKSFADNRQQLAELAEIGALREAFPGTGPLSKTIKWADKTTRLVLDDVYKSLADQGLVEKTETVRREFVNQVGQYNKRLQPQFTVWLRDTGFGPFVTAGKTFNALGVRNMILSPGLKATSPAAAGALRMNQLSGWVGAAVLTGTLNYLLTKNNGGGVMGRPGVPVGNVDSGLNDKKGNPLSLPLANILGYGRALRVSGTRGVIESQRLGLNPSETLDASLKDIANAAIAPIAGPAVRFGMIAATGHAPAVDVGRASPVAGPHQSQFGLNVQTALREANPVVASSLDVKEGKPLSEAIGRQLPRFTLQQSKSAQQVAQMPKIVDRARLNEYVDDLSRRARKLPLNERVQFVQQEMEKAQLLPSERGLVIQKIQSRIRYP